MMSTAHRADSHRAPHVNVLGTSWHCSRRVEPLCDQYRSAGVIQRVLQPCSVTTMKKNLNENTPTDAWWPSCSRSRSPVRDPGTCHNKIDSGDVGIVKHIDGTPLVPSSLSPIWPHLPHAPPKPRPAAHITCTLHPRGSQTTHCRCCSTPPSRQHAHYTHPALRANKIV